MQEASNDADFPNSLLHLLRFQLDSCPVPARESVIRAPAVKHNLCLSRGDQMKHVRSNEAHGIHGGLGQLRFGVEDCRARAEGSLDEESRVSVLCSGYRRLWVLVGTSQWCSDVQAIALVLTQKARFNDSSIGFPVSVGVCLGAPIQCVNVCKPEKPIQ